MSKKIVKIITCLCLVTMVLSFATSALALTPGEIKGDTSVKGTQEIQNVGQSIVGILQTVGIVLSVIVLIVLGIKYMMGSAEEKAEYKKTLLPYFIGAIFVFGAGAITTVIFNMAGADWTA